MAIITNSIGSAGGRDYATIALWIASLPASAVTAGNSYVGECYNDSEFLVAGGVGTISNTTDASHTITLTTAPGQSFRDNASVQSNALRYNQSNGVALRSTDSYVSTITLSTSNIILSKLQIKATGVGPNTRGVDVTTGTAEINNCICEITGTQDGTFGQGVIFGNNATLITCRNSLFVSAATHTNTASVIFGTNTPVTLYFCTIVMPSDLTPTAAGVTLTYQALIMENCAVFGCVAVAGGSGSRTYTTCMTDVGSPPSGFSTVTYANQFQNTLDGVYDYRMKAGANLQGAGTADSTNGATDIAGTSRPQGINWDIGAWELVASVPASTAMGMMIVSY